ncbi:Transporter [Aphelenchoides fujianensis]|nr:Transporter [Aphelenchoides fujianensis]
MGAFFFNGSCHSNQTVDRRQFFSMLSAKSGTMEEIGGINWRLFCSLFVAWTITAVVLLRGVKIMGRIAWFTGSVPYFIVIILFVRGITLEGAEVGLRFYLTEP